VTCHSSAGTAIVTAFIHSPQSWSCLILREHIRVVQAVCCSSQLFSEIAYAAGSICMESGDLSKNQLPVQPSPIYIQLKVPDRVGSWLGSLAASLMGHRECKRRSVFWGASDQTNENSETPWNSSSQGLSSR